MPVTSLIMVRYSIRKKFWKALGLLYQMTVGMTGKQWGKRWGKPPKNDQSLNACNFLNNDPIFNP